MFMLFFWGGRGCGRLWGELPHLMSAESALTAAGHKVIIFDCRQDRMEPYVGYEKAYQDWKDYEAQDGRAILLAVSQAGNPATVHVVLGLVLAARGDVDRDRQALAARELDAGFEILEDVMREITCWRLESMAEVGPNALVARFASQNEAEAAKSCAGGYGPEIRREDIVIYDTAVEFSPALNTRAIETGLAKLSDDEKKALQAFFVSGRTLTSPPAPSPAARGRGYCGPDE